MKYILLVSTEPFEGTWAYYSLGILNALKKENNKLIFIYMEGDSKQERLIPKKIKRIKISKRKLKYKRILQKIYPSDLKRNIIKVCKQYPIHIIHFISPDYIITYIIPFLMRLSNLIYTVHDVVPHDYKLKGIKEHLFVKYLYNRIRKNIKLIPNLATNSYYQKKLLTSKYPHKKHFYFRMPSHITEIIKRGNQCCPELIKEKYKYILYFGSMHSYKGIDILIKAYLKSHLPYNVKLVLAGDGSYNPLKEYCDSRIIFIHRHIKDNEIRYLFKNAHCVVYPYTSITQTAVIQFPYYFKTPVIASDLEYFKNCIVDRKTGFLFENANIDQLTKLLEYVCSETFDPESIKMAMAEQFEKCYSHEGLANELMSIYESVGKEKE